MENVETAYTRSGKRKHSIKDTDHTIPKRLCKNFKLPNDVQDEYTHLLEKSSNPCQTNEYRSNLPHTLIRFMYQLELLMFCLVRKYIYNHKYSSLSLTFRISKIGKFNNIVLCYKQKSIYIQIENVDKYYTDNAISYDRLFAKGKCSLINNHFDNFVKHLISKPYNVLNNIKYLIFYTNSHLELTEEKILRKRRFKNFYPFKFCNINMEKSDILKTFLFTNNNVLGRDFYQFSLDKITKREFLNRLKFSPSIQDEIEKRNFSQEFIEEIKEAFLHKLVFAVKQPTREELNDIVKSALANNSEVQENYIALKEWILYSLTILERDKKHDYISGMIYEFNLLISFLHSMFLHKYMYSLNFERKQHDTSNDIIVNYKNKITHIKVYAMTDNIDYDQLFPCKQQEKKKMFSVNKHFTLFTEELKGEIRFFIIYTNTELDLTVENILKEGKSKNFCPLKFSSIRIQNKKYKILRDCSFLATSSLYQFSREKTTREELMKLLKLPSSLQKEKEEGRFSDRNEKEIKEKFLYKLIFAVKQPNKERLGSIIRNQVKTDIESNKVPYNYDDLREIALRWLECREYGHMTKEVMERLLQDIKKSRFSYRTVQTEDIEKVKFAKYVIGNEETPAFYQFCDYLTKGDGKKCLEVLKKKEIMLNSMSSILTGVKANAPKTFKDLYDLWFDEQGNETHYLRTLKKEKIKLINMSSILNGAGVTAAKSFKSLYDMWFDKQGNKTKYLQILEKEKINLANISNILSAAGANAVKAFKDLFDTWFDRDGNKTQYLRILEDKEVNLSNISGILGGAGTNASKTFKEIYDLWFDDKGNETQYLRTLKENGVKLPNISSILSGTGTNAPKAFKDLYDLWFDGKGNKTKYLSTLEKEGIKLVNITSILHKARVNTPKAFKDLYNLWFDEKENKTIYLKTLEKEGIHIVNISSILSGSGVHAPKAFMDLYNLWFDENGKTMYLKTLEKEGINLSNMSNMLHASRSNAVIAFKELYDIFFDKQGNKTKYLKALEKEGINFVNVFNILSGSGVHAPKAFMDLYNLWFDEKENTTEYIKTLQKEGINMSCMSNILRGSRGNVVKAFKGLYNILFDKQGNKSKYLKTFEKAEISIYNISNILSGTGVNSEKTFKDMYNLLFDKQGNKTKYLKILKKRKFSVSSFFNIVKGAGVHIVTAFTQLYNAFFDEEGHKTQRLKHFTEKNDSEKNFKNSNLSTILVGAGIHAEKAFEKFHNVCFDNDGNKTQILNDFYKEGFSSTSITCLLLGTGIRASSTLKRWHKIFFNEKRGRTELLDGFCNVGFRPNDISNILSRGIDKAKEFYDFCFADETKKYLHHFINKKNGFTLSNLCHILRGAGCNICKALQDFYDVCFDETGKDSQILNDFYAAGFSCSNLCSILFSSGSNAANIFRNFHKCCFNKENHLDHFLKENIFLPYHLSFILFGVGIKSSSTFKKLHDLCFDEMGNKTVYLHNLMKNNSEQIIDVLLAAVRRNKKIRKDHFK